MRPDKADAYVLGRDAAETRRLIAQHRIYGPITRRFFEAAGIGPGMKVLDLGSGAGDVAMLVAELVGPRGQVIGIDENADILRTARERVDAAALSNVTFVAGDVGTPVGETDFDAVVGRWVLMYLPDPAAILRHAATLLRPGGLIAFHEMDVSHPPASFPPTEIMTALQDLMIPPPEVEIPDVRIGTKLFRLFVEAGLVAPELRMEAPLGGGPDWPGYDYTVETLRSLAPALRQLTGYDVTELGLDTLSERMRDQIVAAEAVQMLPPIVGAWSRKG